MGPGFVAFSAETGGNAGVMGWEVWVSQFSEGHGAEAANNRNGGDRVCLVDEGVSVKCRELGEYFQLLSCVG